MQRGPCFIEGGAERHGDFQDWLVVGLQQEPQALSPA